MNQEIAQRKIVFFIDSIVRNPFSTPLNEDINKPMILTSASNIVKEGDIIATVILENEMSKFSASYDIQPFLQLGEGKNVVFDAHTQEYKALCYGFARVTDTRKMEVQPIIFPSRNKLQAFMYIYQTKNYEFPNINDIKKSLQYEGIIYPAKDETIEKQLLRILEHNELEGTAIIVASGVKPVDGQIEHVILKKVTEKKVGTLREDGSMDYKEKEYLTKVATNELICELKPYIPAQNGYDVYGQPIPAKMLGEKKYKIGKNLVPSKENPNLYVASKEGVLQIDSSFKINVENTVYIKKDVDINTGNLNINGNIEIGGSVQPGFRVSATGSILVGMSVEDAMLEAGSDIIINNGILGKSPESCIIKANGNVAVKFVQNAKIFSGSVVRVKESVVQSEVNARDSIQIGGYVIGGRVVGKNGIEVGTAGSSSFTKTLIIAGRDFEIEEKIENMNNEIKVLQKGYKDHIDDMKMNFGEGFLKDMANFVKGLIGPRKVKFVTMLKELKDFNTKINDLTAEREKLKESIIFTKPPTIIIKAKAYPEVYIQIKNSIKKIDKEMDATSFREDPELKVII